MRALADPRQMRGATPGPALIVGVGRSRWRHVDLRVTRRGAFVDSWRWLRAFLRVCRGGWRVDRRYGAEDCRTGS